MDWTTLPPLAALRAFEAAARNLNYSAAGRELNVSHAAIAQQVRLLERFTGLRLAERAGRGIALTPEGRLLAGHLTSGFEEIAGAFRALSTAEADRPLHVTMTPSFAVSWFMPRMPLFRMAHPDIDLVVNPTVENVDLSSTGCDIAIRFGAGVWPGLESELLLPSNFVIVAAPSVVGDNWQGRPEDLATLPWLQELGTEEVEQWLASQGIEMPARAHITEMPGYLLERALRDGQGAAVTARVFVETDIAEGRLIALHEETQSTSAGYHLAWRPGIQRPAVKQFVRWIKKAAKESLEGPRAFQCP